MVVSTSDLMALAHSVPSSADAKAKSTDLGVTGKKDRSSSAIPETPVNFVIGNEKENAQTDQLGEDVEEPWLRLKLLHRPEEGFEIVSFKLVIFFLLIFV
jgi:hypothetical protein